MHHYPPIRYRYTLVIALVWSPDNKRIAFIAYVVTVLSVYKHILLKQSVNPVVDKLRWRMPNKRYYNIPTSKHKKEIRKLCIHRESHCVADKNALLWMEHDFRSHPRKLIWNAAERKSESERERERLIILECCVNVSRDRSEIFFYARCNTY